MEESIKVASLSESLGARVGAVLVKDGEILVSSYKGELGKNIHAEEGVLIKAKKEEINIKDTTLFTTLEPCNERKKRESCCDLIIKAGIKTVYIGAYDINPEIYRNGWKKLRDKNIELKDFTSEYREKCKEINVSFESNFESATGIKGGAKFDYTLNGGRFVFYFDNTHNFSIESRWSRRGKGSIYANSGVPGFVALAKYASKFEEIDDPDALDYNSHSVGVCIGEIVVFRNKYGHALIKITDVESGPDYGSKHTLLKFQYLLRPRIQ